MLPYHEYLAANRLIKYPLAEQATLPSDWPLDFLIDLVVVTTEWSIPWEILTVDVQPTTIGLTLTTGITVTITRGSTTLVTASATTVDSSVKIVCGHTVLPWSVGTYSYSGTLPLEASVVVPRGATVTSVNSYTDAVSLAGGYNTGLSVAGGQLLLTFRPGAGQGNPPCPTPSNPGIYTVNGLATSGNLVINGSACIEVRPEATDPLLVFHDRCTPCCATCPDDLESLNTALDLVQLSLDDLDARLTALGG